MKYIYLVTAVQILVPISKVRVVRLMRMDYFVAEKRSVGNGKKLLLFRYKIEETIAILYSPCDFFYFYQGTQKNQVRHIRIQLLLRKRSFVPINMYSPRFIFWQFFSEFEYRYSFTLAE